MAADIEDIDRIIGQFLDFARAAAGEPAEPARSRGTRARACATAMREAGQPLREEIEPVPPLRLRPLAIRRLIANLIDNALRHGGGEVALRVVPADGGAGVEVLDRGPGIPAEEVERLKQPFTRLETARSGTGGTGLGLAIVDRIARLHGGRFDLAARDGGGLVARVVFPRGISA